MRHGRSTILGAVVLAGLCSAAPAAAITFGHPDRDLHPSTGALVSDYDRTNPGLEPFCTGTLIAERVVLTASHCAAGLDEDSDQVQVSFASAFDDAAADPGGLWTGTFVAHPQFGSGGAADGHDIAVVLLDEAPPVEPVDLPREGLLDDLKASHALDDQAFTAVGYGVVRTTKTGGPHGFQAPDGVRRYALQEALSLRENWLLLSMNPSTGNGGTCYGDSGGPHFLGGVSSDLLVSITITGDAMCRATDRTYRLDSESAREFLREFVTLP